MKKTKLGQELISGLQEIISHKRGEVTLRTNKVALPGQPPEYSKEEITEIRVEKLKVSQPIFAAYLGVAVAVVRSWEQGQKSPSGAARRLLQIVASDPSMVQKVVNITDRRKTAKPTGSRSRPRRRAVGG